MSLDEADVPFWALTDTGHRRREDPPEDTEPAGEPATVIPPTGDSGDITIGRTKIPHLARDSRVPVWRRRIIISAVIGMFAAFFFLCGPAATPSLDTNLTDAMKAGRSRPRRAAAQRSADWIQNAAGCPPAGPCC